jgi:molybdopterin biosynthesis enzyme
LKAARPVQTRERAAPRNPLSRPHTPENRSNIRRAGAKYAAGETILRRI